MRQEGFTLIELIIVVMVLVVATIIGVQEYNSLNAESEVHCINGLQWMVGRDGSTHQVLDTTGNGIACQ